MGDAEGYPVLALGRQEKADDGVNTQYRVSLTDEVLIAKS
jgi:hypothetical protein